MQLAVYWPWIAAGLHVKGTVRSLASREKIQHLLDMQQEFPGKLTLLEADLLQPGSFAEAVRDVDYVRGV